MVTQSTLRSPTPSPSSYKGSKVGFISPQASNIFRYTQMAETPKMSNGHTNDENNHNSNNYFNRVRKQSAGHTPFAIYDASSVSSHSSDKKSTVNSPSAPAGHIHYADGSTPYKFGEAVALLSPVSGRPPRRTVRSTTAFNNSKASSYPAVSFNQLRGARSDQRGYLLDAANPSSASSTNARGQLGRLHNTRAESLFGATTPTKEVLKLLDTKSEKESKYYQAPFEVARELKEIVQAQSQEIFELKQNNEELLSRVEMLEDQQVAATSKSKNRRKKKLGFQSPTSKIVAPPTHRMTLRRRKNQN